MLSRLKRVLVESFVGAIALGYLFAQGLLHVAGMFAAPFASSIARQQFQSLEAPLTTGLLLRDAVPELIRAASTLLIAYVLLRWLYYKPLDKAAAQDAPAPLNLE